MKNWMTPWRMRCYVWKFHETHMLMCFSDKSLCLLWSKISSEGSIPRKILKSTAIQVLDRRRMLEDELWGELRAVKLNWFVVLRAQITAIDLMQESGSCLELSCKIYTYVLEVALSDSDRHTHCFSYRWIGYCMEREDTHSVSATHSQPRVFT